jgi:peroxiredoxin
MEEAVIIICIKIYFMRKIFLLFICLFLINATILKSQEKKSGYTIEGDLTAIPDAAMVYLVTSNQTDSAKVEHGKFTFTGMLDVAERVNLRLKHVGQSNITTIIHEDNLKLFLSNTRILVKSAEKFDKSVIQAGKLHEEYINYYEGLLKIYKEMQPVNTRYYASVKLNDVELMRQTKSKLDSLRKIEFDYATGFIRKNPKSPVALFVVHELAKPIANPPDFPSAFLLLDPSLQNTRLGKSLKAMIDIQNAYKKGDLIPNFTQPDINGKLINVSDFKGKYLLVDFWASWCGPCRLDNPNLKQAFEKYRKDGLVVLAVSIDDAKEKWIKAINQDGTGGFIQVGDMKGRQNSAAQLLKVKSIPQNYLIDPNGKILGKNLHGMELNTALEKIFKN